MTETRLVAFHPAAPGWRVVWALESGAWTQALAGWGVYDAEGYLSVRPLIIDVDGPGSDADVHPIVGSLNLVGVYGPGDDDPDTDTVSEVRAHTEAFRRRLREADPGGPDDA